MNYYYVYRDNKERMSERNRGPRELGFVFCLVWRRVSALITTHQNSVLPNNCSRLARWTNSSTTLNFTVQRKIQYTTWPTLSLNFSVVFRVVKIDFESILICWLLLNWINFFFIIEKCRTREGMLRNLILVVR
jgi:hypothetical protein